MSRRRDEAGAVLVFVTIWTLTLLVATGLVYDGGLILAAQRRAFAVAELAAQAGAQALDATSLRAGGDAVLLDPDRVNPEVQSYLADAGYQGTVAATEELVTVRVRVAQPVGLLGLVGLGPVDVVGVGTSRPVSGTTRQGD